MHTLILGVGNILFHDDGVGVWVIKHLQEQYEIPSSIDLIDGGIGGLNLLTLMEGYDYIIVIDTIKGNNVPGTVYNLSMKDVDGPQDLSYSSHGGVQELLEVHETLHKRIPVRIIGVEPMIEEPGIGLSVPVQKGVEEVLRVIIKELQKIGIFLKERS